MFTKVALLLTLAASVVDVFATPIDTIEMRAVTLNDTFRALAEARSTTPAIEKRAVVASDYLNPHNAARSAVGHA